MLGCGKFSSEAAKPNGTRWSVIHALWLFFGDARELISKPQIGLAGGSRGGQSVVVSLEVGGIFLRRFGAF